MYKSTDVLSLGTEYNITDHNGVIVKKIQIIPQTEILEAALGEYTDLFENTSAYLEKSIAVLSGFDKVDMNKVYWYATFDEEVILADVLEYAVKYGYDRIILEHLEDVE